MREREREREREKERERDTAAEPMEKALMSLFCNGHTLLKFLIPRGPFH